MHILPSCPHLFIPFTFRMPPAARMGGPRYPVSSRKAAVKAYWWGHEDHHEACGKYKELVPDPAERPNDNGLWGFITYWADHFNICDCCMQFRSPPGQQPAMPDDVADECISLLMGGYNVGRAHRWFSSVSDALKRSARLKQLADQYKYNNRTLLRRLKHRDPTISRRTLRFIKRLKAGARQQRLSYCKGLLAMGDAALQRYLARIVWVDAKNMYICPKPYLVYAPPGAQLLVADDRLPGSRYDVKKIHYYAGVNAVLGACHYKTCSGTTGYKELCDKFPHLKTYKVGAAPCTPASNLYELV